MKTNATAEDSEQGKKKGTGEIQSYPCEDQTYRVKGSCEFKWKINQHPF